MEFPSALTQAVLLKRYKRFLAEIILNNQEHRIIYCPNIGAMTGCDLLGSRIWFSHSDNPRRKFPQTWELIEVNAGYLVAINPQYAKILLEEGICNGMIRELQGYTHINRESISLEENDFDLVLEKNTDRFGSQTASLLPTEKCFVIAKSVTLGDEIHRGFYPDAPCETSAQQLAALIRAKELGYRAVLFYCALHTGIQRIFPADHLDADYGSLLRQAMIAGVEIIGYQADISLESISLARPIEVCIPARMLCPSKAEKSRGSRI